MVYRIHIDAAGGGCSKPLLFIFQATFAKLSPAFVREVFPQSVKIVIRWDSKLPRTKPV